VAAYSGDIRRSLQITKRAVEICRDSYLKNKNNLGRPLPKVGIKHIMDAYEEMSNSKTVHVLKSLRKYEVLVILALFLELKSSKLEKVLMDKVQDRCQIIINNLAS
jgi:Cdc6-like AAA superfamily ATPase